jgi:hypothetical protein
MIFATLVVALLLLPFILTYMLFQALLWYCCWSTMNYIFYYILHSYCCHPWWIVELQVPLLLLVLYCCNSIVIDAILFCYYCHPWQPINSSKQPNYEETSNKNYSQYTIVSTFHHSPMFLSNHTSTQYS